MVTRRNDERTVAGRHRMMRRADREVTEPQQIDAIIATCKIVSLAYTDAEGITIVPLNFGYVFDAESNHLTLSATKSRIQRARKRLRGNMIQKCRVLFDEHGSVCCFTPQKS